jgi:hypothetical protein
MTTKGMGALAYFLERVGGQVDSDAMMSVETYAEDLVEAVREEMREEIADDIAFVGKASAEGRAHRPRYETGGYYNDVQWMEKVAREGRPEGIED